MFIKLARRVNELAERVAQEFITLRASLAKQEEALKSLSLNRVTEEVSEYNLKHYFSSMTSVQLKKTVLGKEYYLPLYTFVRVKFNLTSAHKTAYTLKVSERVNIVVPVNPVQDKELEKGLFTINTEPSNGLRFDAQTGTISGTPIRAGSSTHSISHPDLNQSFNLTITVQA